MGIAWSDDLESCAGSNVVTGRALHVRQTSRNALVLQVWGWALGCQSHLIKNKLLQKLALQQSQGSQNPARTVVMLLRVSVCMHVCACVRVRVGGGGRKQLKSKELFITLSLNGS